MKPTPRTLLFAAIAAAADRRCRAAGAGVLDHAAQPDRAVRDRRARPGAAHRRGRPHVVRPGGVRRRRRLRHRGAQHQARAVALARAAGGHGPHGGDRAGAGGDHAAHVGPLPAAGHDRLGPVAQLHDGQRRRASAATTACSASRRWSVFGISLHDGRKHVRADLGGGAAGGAWRRCGCSIRARAARSARSRAAPRWPRRWASRPIATRW